jgi:hypothetical protein
MLGSRSVRPLQINEQVRCCRDLSLSHDSGSNIVSSPQIVLYVSSRVLASFLPRLLSSTSSTASLPPTSPSSSVLPANLRPLSSLSPLTSKAANPRPIPPADTPFAIFAALSWGLVMYVYRHHGERLQPGMVNSMCKSIFEQRVNNTRYSLTRAISHSLSVPRFRGLE